MDIGEDAVAKMIRVKMTTSLTNPTGTWNEGQVYDVDAGMAREWINKGFAIEWKDA